MPNWLGDFVMAIPLIKAIQAGRPDVEITLLCQEQFVGLSCIFGYELFFELSSPYLRRVFCIILNFLEI